MNDPDTGVAMKGFGVGVIGLGMAAAPHLKSLRDLSEIVTVRGAFSRTAEKRKSVCDEYGMPEAHSVESMLADDVVDAVLILTPPNARMDLVRACAAAGKHILMEKPIERSVAAAEEIVGICENAGVHLGIVFQHRYRPDAIRLRALLASGKLGEIGAVRVQIPWWRDQAYYDEPGRGTLERDGGGVLISQAIHTLDLMLSLLGPVILVQAIAATTRLHAMEAEDFVAAGLQFANGAPGSLVATTAAFPGFPEAIEIDCENATARWQSAALTVHWRDGRVEGGASDVGTGAGADPMAFPHDWHRDLIADFVGAVQEDRQPAVSGRVALNVHYLIDALLESARTGTSQPVRNAVS